MTDDSLPIPDAKHVLYRFYDASGALLYVGITAKPIRRFRDHQKTKDWWTEVSSIRVENFSSRLELIYGERRAMSTRSRYITSHTTTTQRLTPGCFRG